MDCNIGRIKCFYLLILFICSSVVTSKDINLGDREVVGDGITDNWLIIQTAIDEVINSGGGTVYFPEGQFAIYDKSIVIWGNNIRLIGVQPNSSTIIKKGRIGYFGECIDISGKVKGYQYYGDFGNGNYNKRKIYDGESVKSNNIRIENLSFNTNIESVDNFLVANNIGIINSSNVVIKNCIFSDSPQSNVSIVNDTHQYNSYNIKFYNCIFQNSGQHNVRVISYNKGNIIGNVVSFDKCKFICVKGEDKKQKELLGYKIHLWYRGNGDDKINFLRINDCYFDDSGFIFINGEINNFKIVDSQVDSFLFVQKKASIYESKMKIERTRFLKEGKYKDIVKLKKHYNIVNKMKNGFAENDFGVIYPANLKIENID